MNEISPHSLASLQFQAYYLKYGLRTDAQIQSPTLRDKRLFALPLKSIYHHVDYTGISVGPVSPNELAFAGNDKPVYYQNVANLSEHEGNPRMIAQSIDGYVRELKSRNRRLRPMQDVSMATRDPHTIVCYNYCLLAKNYRYLRSAMTEYYRWFNIFSTIVDNLADLVQKVDSHHFLFMNVPPIVPSMQQFQKAAHTLDASCLKFLNSPDSFTAFDVWRWMGQDRQTSILSKLPENKLKLINFVYFENGKWTILNLHYLNALRRADDPDAWEKAQLGPNAGMSPHQTQMRFTLFLTKVMQARMVSSVSDDDAQGAHIDQVSTDQLRQDTADQIEDQITLNVRDDDLAETDEEKAARIAQDDVEIEKTLATLNDIGEQTEAQDAATLSVHEVINKPALSHHDAADQKLNELAENGILTAANYKRLQALSRQIDVIKVPGKDIPLSQFHHVDMAEMVIDKKPKYVDNPTIVDKSMLHSTVESFDETYITKALEKDVVGMCTQLNKGGYFVTDFQVEENHDILGSYKDYSVKLTPLEGAPSTIRFKLPVLQKDGSFRANGVDYQISKMFGDRPIRKISPQEVALSSYYGKTFVERGRKVATNVTQWYHNQTMLAAMDDASVVETASPGNVFDQEGKYPKDYTTMAQGFSMVKVNGIELYFSLAEAREKLGAELVDKYHKQGYFVLGVGKNGPVYMDSTSAVLQDQQGKPAVLGHLWQVMKFSSPPPVEYAEIAIFGQDIPVGIVLAYYMGLTKLCKMLGITPERQRVGTRTKIDEENNFTLSFQDEILIFPRENRLAVLVLAGFRDYHATIKQYAVHNFDKRSVYASLMEAKNINVRFLREMEQLQSYFIDPITHRLLEQMKEPTTWEGLVLRAVELLLTDAHLEEIDMRDMRIKGSERIAGAVYMCLMDSIRKHNGSMGKAARKVEMNPYAVWKLITEDPAKFQKNEINPVHAVKEREALTFSGVGGRSKQSMVKDTRYFHETHKGVVSEATKDSGDVGVNVFLSPNANFTDAYGNVEQWDNNKHGTSSLISTPVLLSPGSDGDDQKRVGFASIQVSHAIAADGYHQPTIRTGYETVLPQRMGEPFCVTAKQKGKVDTVTANGITVTYADGSKGGYTLGRHFGNASGLTIPHQLMTALKPGQEFDVGHAIAYNSGFVEPDILDPRRPVYKCTMDVRTVLWESTQTLEDACSISPRLAGSAGTKTTKVKNVTVKFSDVVSKLITVGTRTEYDTVVCYIQDAVSGNSGAFSDETMDSLNAYSAQSPRAGCQGIVERVEVYYHGDMDDMSDTLKAIAIKSNKDMKQRQSEAGKPIYTGSVDSGFRIDGEPLGLDEVAIRVYITTNVVMGVGDKGVFANQLKTVCSEVMQGEYRTEDNKLVDAIFGNQSVDARIVTSVYRIGIGAMIMKEVTRLAIEAYDS